MKIVAAGQELSLKEPIEISVEHIIARINQVAVDRSLIFMGLRINGEEVYENFEETIIENLEKISIIEAILVTEEQLLADTLLSIYSYVTNSLTVLPSLIEEMYRPFVPSTAWTELGNLVEGLKWMHIAAKFASKYKDTLNFEEELEYLNTALTQKDNVLIGDIIYYEIVPRFEMIQTLLAEFGNHEVS